MIEIKIKYFDKELPPIIFREGGDWLDLYSRIDLEYKSGELVRVPLNVAIKLPKGYEALLRPRSSTSRNCGLIHASSGVIDNSYSGDSDEWIFLGYAIRDGNISRGQRIAQFRIFENMPKVRLTSVESLESPNRGGFGSTGMY